MDAEANKPERPFPFRDNITHGPCPATKSKRAKPSQGPMTLLWVWKYSNSVQAFYRCDACGEEMELRWPWGDSAD